MLTSNKIIWTKDTFLTEKDAFLRVSKKFVPTHDSQRRPIRQTDVTRLIRANMEYLERVYGPLRSTVLQEHVWRSLENTDSWTALTSSAVLRSVNSKKATSGPRDIAAVIEEFNTGRVRCPIILQYGNSYTLVAGNTRLMIARVGRIVPKVIIIPTDW